MIIVLDIVWAFHDILCGYLNEIIENMGYQKQKFRVFLT
jgi:hypothetical protein